MPPTMEVEGDNTNSVTDIDFDNILQAMNKPLRKDCAWYLVDKKWYEKFEKFVANKQSCNNPGPIDNTNLFEPLDGELREIRDNLQDELDYKLIPEEAWHFFCSFFDIVHESHAIKRWVIEEGLNVKLCSVEVYPVDLIFGLFGKPKTKMTHRCSRTTKVSVLLEIIKHYFEIDPLLDTRLRHFNSVLDIDKTLSDCGIATGHIVVLEVQTDNGTWPSQSRFGAMNTRSTARGSCNPGVCGLENLGNTCFMNSAVQCLSNTPPLTQYILSKKYEPEINRTSRLGMGGKIAEKYADLITNMWSGNFESFIPREFKYVVGCWAPQFGGFAQQDSQEWMMFLLNGLHEDLNRIIDKPYIEIRAGVDTRPDHVIAEEALSNFRKREDSIITDTFHGLLKSTVVCPDCNVVSTTFDTFSCLSLPLEPQKGIDLVVVLRDQVAVGKLVEIHLEGLSIPTHGLISDICKDVSNVIATTTSLDRIDPMKLVVVEVYQHRLLNIYHNYDNMASGRGIY